MSTPPRAVVVLGLLVLMTSFGVAAVMAAPEGGRGIGIRPVALAGQGSTFRVQLPG